MECASNVYNLEDPLEKIESFESVVNSDLGVITTDNDVERAMSVVNNTTLLGVECTTSEKNAGIATGTVCGVAVGLFVAKSMVSNHKTILDGIKFIGKCISTFA